MKSFNDMSHAEQEACREEFENWRTTRERRVEILTLLQEGADENEMGGRCPRCKHYPFFAPYHEALIEGHVYSRAGVDEIRITGYCEYCFDLVTQEPDEEDSHE